MTGWTLIGVGVFAYILIMAIALMYGASQEDVNVRCYIFGCNEGNWFKTPCGCCEEHRVTKCIQCDKEYHQHCHDVSDQ